MKIKYLEPQDRSSAFGPSNDLMVAMPPIIQKIVFMKFIVLERCVHLCRDHRRKKGFNSPAPASI